MSVAYIVEALFEETLRELDQRAEHELWRIGNEMSYWLRHMLMRMPCDTWRYEFDRQIAKMAREHVIVAEESCRAWIDRLRACNEAAEEDARAMGSAEAVRARMREYFKWPDPPQYPHDKPAPFDPDYPQLRGTGNSIMERSPPDEWVDQAEFALQSYRVPQEIKDAFIGWLAAEQSKAAAGAQPAERQVVAGLELAMADGAEPQEQVPTGKGGAVAADERGELHWIPFERHMENEGVLVYKTIDATGAHWWKVPVKKTTFKGHEVYDLRGAVEFEPTFVQGMLLEHDGVIDDKGWEIILRHYLDQYGDEADEQLLKDLASGDAGPALKKYVSAQAISILIGTVVGKSLKRIKKIKSSKVRKALDRVKTRLERLSKEKKPDAKKVEKELREATDELRGIADKSADAETKKAVNEIADDIEGEATKAAKEVEKLGGPAADAGPPPRKTKRAGDNAPEPKPVDGDGLGRVFAATRERATKFLGPGEGITDKWGNVRYSLLGSADEIALARHHEAVHSFLSPKFTVLRELRADLRIAAYQRSSVLKYAEEALAETYAQLRVNGFKGTLTGIAFPIKNGYVTISQLAKEGAIGTIIVGGVTYSVYTFINE